MLIRWWGWSEAPGKSRVWVKSQTPLSKYQRSIFCNILVFRELQHFKLLNSVCTTPAEQQQEQLYPLWQVKCRYWGAFNDIQKHCGIILTLITWSIPQIISYISTLFIKGAGGTNSPGGAIKWECWYFQTLTLWCVFTKCFGIGPVHQDWNLKSRERGIEAVLALIRVSRKENVAAACWGDLLQFPNFLLDVNW